MRNGSKCQKSSCGGRAEECAVKNLVIEAQADARLHHVVARVMQEPAEIAL